MKKETVDKDYNSGTPDQYKLHLGRPGLALNKDGIIFTYQDINSALGHYEMVQLVNAETDSITLKSGGVVTHKWQSGSGSFPALDTQYPYTLDYVLVSGYRDRDSPGGNLPNDDQSRTLSDDFEDYLMFHPNTSDWCWVPIGTMNWSAGGIATNSKDATGVFTDVWVGNNFVPSVAGTIPPFVPAGSNPPFPSWSDNISSFGYF